jgi:hypothetical protein
MSSVSGLSAAHRLEARTLARRAALLGLRRAPLLHYTQSGLRWEGIANRLKAYRGKCPTHADCSAFVTWCLWNGLDHFDVRDTVNGQNWRAGYTGTMIEHGKPVRHHGNALVGDGVLYGDPFGSSGHTAIIVGHKAGRILVVSFGSEAGPFLLPYDYRPVTAIRRYV